MLSISTMAERLPLTFALPGEESDESLSDTFSIYSLASIAFELRIKTSWKNFCTYTLSIVKVSFMTATLNICEPTAFVSCIRKKEATIEQIALIAIIRETPVKL